LLGKLKQVIVFDAYVSESDVERLFALLRLRFNDLTQSATPPSSTFGSYGGSYGTSTYGTSGSPSYLSCPSQCSVNITYKGGSIFFPIS
jgi:hypothetical protein